MLLVVAVLTLLCVQVSAHAQGACGCSGACAVAGYFKGGGAGGWSWVGGLNACWNDVWGFQVFGLLGSNGAGKTTTVRATKRKTPMTRVKLQRKSAFNKFLRAGGYDNERAAADIWTSSRGGY